MKLCLVTNLSKQKVSFTGIGRYADALKKYLLIDTSILYAEDFAGSSAVLRTFPLQLPFKNYSPETIFHLTCQTFTIPLIWQKPKQPVIVTVHDIIPMVTKKYYGFADKILTFLTLRGLKKATHLIADSEHTKKDIIAHLHIPENKISVVPLGVDHTKFYPSKAKKQKNTILYVGSEHARKNLPVLIRAIAEVKKTIPSVILVKVGESQDEKEHTSLVQLIKKENLESNITWKGYVDNLTQEYQQASLFIYP